MASFNEKGITGASGYLIFFDNIRVDQYVLSFRTSISLSGGMGSATLEMLYVPDFYETDPDDSSLSAKVDGIEDMTTVRIFSKNMFNGKYVQIFEGNLRRKSRTRSAQGYTLSFSVVDYMSWMNRTIVPMSIPVDSTYQNQLDILRWRAQGIDTSKTDDLNTNADISFVDKTLKEYINLLVRNTFKNNAVFSDANTVAAWDNPTGRIYVMGDIREELVRSQVVNFKLATNVTYLNSIYVAINEAARNLMFEFFQDKDGIIRVKPPFWNEKLLRDHVVDPQMIININEDTDYEKRITRSVVAGSLEEWDTGNTNLKGQITPASVYVGDLEGNAGFFATSSETGNSVQDPDADISTATNESVSNPSGTYEFNLSGEQVEIIEWIIQGEAGGGSLKHKQIIAYVMVNRLAAGGTFDGSINNYKQFNGVTNYTTRKYAPDTDTKTAVYNVFGAGSCPDESQGAQFFVNRAYAAESSLRWFDTLTFLFELEGHSFYK